MKGSDTTFMDAAKHKEGLRQRMREHRRGCDAEQLREDSDVIGRKALALQEVDGASVVCCYLAMRGEVGTDLLLQAFWTSGRRVYVPAFDPDRGAYRWAKLEAHTKLATGPWNTTEPAVRTWIGDETPDLIITPGMAFDRSGSRLGHGGGSYDRLLVEAPAAARVGLALERQIVETVPVEDHDQGVDIIVTEKSIYRCSENMNMNTNRPDHRDSDASGRRLA